MPPLEPRTEPVGQTPLERTRPQRVALLTWTDRRGTHEVTIDKPTTVGSSPSLSVVIDDPSVSRMHVELDPRDDGVAIRDLGSTNRTQIDSLVVQTAVARDNVRLRLGRAELVVHQGAETVTAQLWPRTEFGRMMGRSAVMRGLFEHLARVAPNSETVLLHGESGTGKELVAEALHSHSPRNGHPFVVLDCGSLHESLAESELFGHAKGAFSGANSARAGHFEAAHGGTLFLDEIGELPLELQPKLLRALESRRVRRLGETEYRDVDVRVISASHRDLRELVNRGAFREDLYFRLAVVPVRVPTLRERPEDVPLLVEHFLSAKKNRLTVPQVVMDALVARSWEGNVRELRNVVDRACILGWESALAGTAGFELRPSIPPVGVSPASTTCVAETSACDVATPASAAETPSYDGTFYEARDRWLEHFERAYFVDVLKRARGNPIDATVKAGVSRGYFRRMMNRLGLKW